MFQETQPGDWVAVWLSHVHRYLHIWADCGLPVFSENKLAFYWIKIKHRES